MSGTDAARTTLNKKEPARTVSKHNIKHLMPPLPLLEWILRQHSATDDTGTTRQTNQPALPPLETGRASRRREAKRSAMNECRECKTTAERDSELVSLLGMQTRLPAVCCLFSADGTSRSHRGTANKLALCIAQGTQQTKRLAIKQTRSRGWARPSDGFRSLRTILRPNRHPDCGYVPAVRA